MNKLHLCSIFDNVCYCVMEKAMVPYSSTLAWKIPWTEEPGGLQSTGLLRVGHDWVTSLSLFTSMHWRRKWQPTPAFLPGEPQGRGSLVGCRLWGRTESDTTEATQQQQQQQICSRSSYIVLWDCRDLAGCTEDGVSYSPSPKRGRNCCPLLGYHLFKR